MHEPSKMHPWVQWLRRNAAAFAAALTQRYNRALKRHGRDVKAQLVRGLSYGFGSGAVSILIVWWENRH